MNWNGNTRNRVIGQVVTCRRMVNERKHVAHNNGNDWMLDFVDPEAHKAALISFCGEMDHWTEGLEEEDREAFLVHAFKEYPQQIRPWLGYKDDWTIMPAAVCKRYNEVVRLAHKGRLPHTYLLPAQPKNPEEAGPIVLDSGYEVVGIRLKTAHYVKWNGDWFKAYYPKLPSKSAVSRAIRLYLMSIILGKIVTSTRDLKAYELFGIRDWLLLLDRTKIAQESANTLFHLLTEPDIIGQLPKVEA